MPTQVALNQSELFRVVQDPIHLDQDGIAQGRRRHAQRGYTGL